MIIPIVAVTFMVHSKSSLNQVTYTWFKKYLFYLKFDVVSLYREWLGQVGLHWHQMGQTKFCT